MDTKGFIECAEVAFSDLKIKGTQEQIEGIAEYFEQSIENSFDSRGEISFYGKSEKEENIDALKEKIKELENRLSNIRSQVESCGNSGGRIWIGARSGEIIIW